MPWLILGRALALNAIRTIQPLEMKDIMRRREMQRLRYALFNVAMCHTVDTLMDTHHAAGFRTKRSA